MAKESYSYTNHPCWFDIYLKSQQELKTRGLKRVGSCTNCGDCCKTLDVEVDFLKKTYKVLRSNDKYCPKWDNKNCLCKTYLGRPLLCRLFPMKPEDLIATPNCTYKFVKVNKKED